MKKLMTLVTALALTAFAWGTECSYVVYVDSLSTNSKWSDATAYVFASSEFYALYSTVVRGWFADGKITQDELAEFQSSPYLMMTGELEEGWFLESGALPDDISMLMEAGETWELNGFVILVDKAGTTATYMQTGTMSDFYTDMDPEYLMVDLSFSYSESTLNEDAIPIHSSVLVTPTKVQQRYPWNGLVDIELYAASNATLTLTAKNMSTGDALSVNTLTLDGESFVNGSTVLTKSSVHLIWDAAADLGDGTLVANAGLRISMAGAVKDIAPYMVVDVSGGSEASSYSVSYLLDAPDGGWMDEYKTTKLVFRRIPAGTFTMGSPEDELGRNSYETQHKVTLSSDYWIGVFEMTQAQYTNIVAVANPSSDTGDMRPVEHVSYNTILGDSGPVSNLIARTGLAFNLPTEAQWEYACRAGTTTALYNGCDLADTSTDDNVNLLARYSQNKTDGKGDSSYTSHTVVGCYQPNDWGLYDMLGNVWEDCLDRFVSDLGTDAVTDPVGTGTDSSETVHRGGSFYDAAASQRAAQRNNHIAPTNESCSNVGFRLVCPVTQD